jgi:hypothetical protein
MSVKSLSPGDIAHGEKTVVYAVRTAKKSA